jgi:hypothetical protein
MAKKKNPNRPFEIPKPEKRPEITNPSDPEEPLHTPAENPEIIPEDDPYENPPPYEIPAPGERP